MGTHERYAALGTIASSAPRTALLHALHRLRPQCAVRLQPCGETRAGTAYRVEMRNAPGTDRGTIDAWLLVKSALMAEFPADKPHAVRAIEP